MPEVTIERLRKLRERARAMLKNAGADLLPFLHEDDLTFRRMPDSPSVSGDVNVTTTCSCLMALALTSKFDEGYDKKDGKGRASATAAFAKLVDASWMSSGLTENNAFTTTLVLRALGFLTEERVLESSASLSPERKAWELDLGLINVEALLDALTASPRDSASDFVWRSLTDKGRLEIRNWSMSRSSAGSNNDIKAQLTLELRRIIQSGWIYATSRFSNVSAATHKLLVDSATAYELASANRVLLVESFKTALRPPAKLSLAEIAKAMGSSECNFRINDYPPSVAVLYWFIDGISRAEIPLSDTGWNALCAWAAKEFSHERSLVVAEHDAMMDPIAMGMSACLCARLRRISSNESLGTTKAHLRTLPSVAELEHSIKELFSTQTDSGIWHKYFPIFHYQDAGSNFCFTFELLEAVLYEFSGIDNTLLGRPLFIEGLEKAVGWCEKSRFDGRQYSGWNSGGHLKSLENEQPESWATAVVHMFLSELNTVVSHWIQKEIMRKYGARSPKKHKSPALGEMMDIDVIPRNKPIRLSKLLQNHIIHKLQGQNEISLRRHPVKKSSSALSALLFGPPGTSKTEITKAVADDLQWPLLEITPSHFVRGTLANIYLQADEIFDDLMDLSGVVVFFDEMDALVQTRDGDTNLDITSQFLTTTMLPKLARLHDQAQVVFFMATNFQDRFDAAIKRAGRFDLLLCMGPPLLSEKLDRLHIAYLAEENIQTTKAGGLIKGYIASRPDLKDRLELFTFGDFSAFLKTIGDVNDIGDKIDEYGPVRFRRELSDYANFVTLNPSDLGALQEISIKWRRLSDLDKKKAKFSLKMLEAAHPKVKITPTLRYFCDRKESKIQY